jgi:hypothetical protein
MAMTDDPDKLCPVYADRGIIDWVKRSDLRRLANWTDPHDEDRGLNVYLDSKDRCILESWDVSYLTPYDDWLGQDSFLNSPEIQIDVNSKFKRVTYAEAFELFDRWKMDIPQALAKAHLAALQRQGEISANPLPPEDAMVQVIHSQPPGSDDNGSIEEQVAGTADEVGSDLTDGKPRWDGEEYILTVNGKQYRPITPKSDSMLSVLQAFEAQGWPNHIKSPNEGDQSRDAVRRLNEALAKKDCPLRFKSRGNKTEICWEIMST